jgi:hypothetical protein
MNRIHPRKPRSNRIGKRGKERWKYKLAGSSKRWQRSCSRACSRDEDRLEETEEEVKEEECLEELEGVAGRYWGWGASGSSKGGSSGSRVSGHPGAAAPGLEVPGVDSGPVLKVPDVDPRPLMEEQAVRRPPLVQIWTMDKARFQNWENCEVGFPPLFDYNCA